MLVKNVFKLNDWKIFEFLILVFALQFSLLGLELLSAMGYDLPLVRPAVGFLYLTFVPGALLLRIFRVHKVSGVESMLYMAGLSLGFDMLAGFLINTLYPCIGIYQPITGYYIILTMFVSVILLSVLCYFRDGSYYDAETDLEIDTKTLAPALFLLLIPLIGVLGSYAVNTFDSDILIYVLIFAVALVTLLLVFTKLIPERLFPLSIVAVAAALLFQNAFTTSYLGYWDVHYEYNVASMVITGSFWDSSVSGYLNAMLSIVFLAPFYAHVCGLELTWVFKIVYQLIFCLVPLGLYVVYARQTDSKVAALACMFFMFLVTFFTEMQGLTRQEVAELFLVLIIMLMTDIRQNKHVKFMLMVVFGMGLIVSHYGLAYVYLLVFVLAFVLFGLVTTTKRLRDRAWKPRPQHDHKKLPADYSLTFTFVGLFTCFLFFWYMYTSQASTLSSISYLLYKMLENIFTEFLNPDKVQGLSYLVRGSSSSLYELKKYMHLAFQGFIAIGFMLVVVQSIAIRKRYNFSVEYIIFSFINLLICIGAIVLPYFASSLNTSRLYHITLIVLSPLCIIGGLELTKAVTMPLTWIKVNIRRKHTVKIMAIIVAVYLFFNTGLIFNLLNDHPMSVPLSKNHMDSYSMNDKGGLYDALNTFEQDYYATGWLSDYKLPGKLLYSDYIAHYPVSSYGNTLFVDERYINRNLSNVRKDSYIYFGYPNLKGGIFKESSGAGAIFSTATILSGLDDKNKIYDSDGCAIYYQP